MQESRYFEIDHIFNAFGFATVQEFFSILLLLKRNNIEIEEFLKYKEYKSVALAGQKNLIKSCPICNKPMHMQSVNINIATQTGDSSKVVYTCVKCMHQIFE